MSITHDNNVTHNKNNVIPNLNAKDYKYQIKKYNGIRFLSVKNKKDKFKWQILKNKYIIHHNYMYPFELYVDNDNKNVAIYSFNDNDNVYNYINKSYTLQILKIKFNKIFYGGNYLDWSLNWTKKFKGNSILLHIKKNKYVYIGEFIASFNTIDNDEIISYYSPICNNDCPLPIAVGKKYSYLIFDKIYINNLILNIYKDPILHNLKFPNTGNKMTMNIIIKNERMKLYDTTDK